MMSQTTRVYTVCTTSMHREDQMLVVSAVRNLDHTYAMGSEVNFPQNLYFL